MLAALTAFTSCSKSDDGLQNQSGEVLNATFSVQAPATRATVNGLSRYIVEVYKCNDLTDRIQRVESASGSLTVALENNTEYTFLFWADYGTAAEGETLSSGNYNASRLTEVKSAGATIDQAGQQAYCLAVTFNSDNFAANASQVLKNAVASVNLVQSGNALATTDNTLKITYPNMGAFNVADGSLTANTPELPLTRTFTVSATTGTLVTDYVLANQSASELVNLTVQLNSETEKTITNVPLQCNYKTNIKGEFSNIYSSAFTVSSEVEDYYTDQEKPLP